MVDKRTILKIGNILKDEKTADELYKIAVGLYGIFLESNRTDVISANMAMEVAKAAFFKGCKKAGYFVAELMRVLEKRTGKEQQMLTDTIIAYYEAAAPEDADAAYMVAQAFDGRLKDVETPFTKPNAYIAGQWYLKSAELGNGKAQYEIGHRYRTGNGVTSNSQLMRDWWEKAANQGHVDAQFNLGLLYNGNFEEVWGMMYFDKNKAGYWFYQAAQNGDVEADRMLKKYRFYYNERKKVWDREWTEDYK